MNAGGKVALLASAADFGTRSISHAFVRLLTPADTLFLDKGFRRMGLAGYFRAWKFLERHRRKGTPVLCLFNAPILLAGLFPLRRQAPWVGILDWTESYPSLRSGRLSETYNQLYQFAFRRLDRVASPVEGFREFYNDRGSRLVDCRYPLPHPIPKNRRPFTKEYSPRFLFIGADYRRKGGDTLLDLWAQLRPAGNLTFVSPTPPAAAIPNVHFLTDIRAGSPEQKRLFVEHDIFLLPSRNEPFGFALLEALNHGMCVATTQVVGAAEIVRRAGGLVGRTTEETIREAFSASSVPTQINQRQAACLRFLPEYEREVSASLANLFRSDEFPG